MSLPRRCYHYVPHLNPQGICYALGLKIWARALSDARTTTVDAPAIWHHVIHLFGHMFDKKVEWLEINFMNAVITSTYKPFKAPN